MYISLIFVFMEKEIIIGWDSYIPTIPLERLKGFDKDDLIAMNKLCERLEEYEACGRIQRTLKEKYD